MKKLHATYQGEPDDLLLCGRLSYNLRYVSEDDFAAASPDACNRCAKAVVRRRVESITESIKEESDPRIEAAFAMSGEEWEALAEYAERELWVWERMEHNNFYPNKDAAERMQKLWRESIRTYQTCAALAERDGEEAEANASIDS